MKRILSLLVLCTIYILALFVHVFAKNVWKLFPNRKRRNRVMVCVTIDNPNWFRAHILPLAESGYGEIVIVCDEPVEQVSNVVYACPPSWLKKVATRAGAKFFWSLYKSWQTPPDLIMGYHIFPAGIIALIAGSLFGVRTAYQVTAGLAEIRGGGHAAENVLLRGLGDHSDTVEWLALKITKSFDLVFVRGTSVREFLLVNGCKNQIEILTGSITTDASEIQPKRNIDVIFVGRLTEVKQLDTLIRAAALMSREIQELRIVLVGDGPERMRLEGLAKTLGVAHHINFVGQQKRVSSYLGQAKVFALTSRSESVSIAMLEAMSMKVVPVVTEVGDLADFVRSGETGFIVPVGDDEKLAQDILKILQNQTLMQRMQEAVQSEVIERCAVAGISRRWKVLLDELSC